MGKQEFIDKLRMHLSSQMSSVQVVEHIRFYEEYIRAELQKGKSEADVMQMLGDPRLIAKTIVEASEYGGENAYSGQTAGDNYGYRQNAGSYSQNTAYSRGYSRQSNTGYDSTGYNGQNYMAGTGMPGWVKILIGVLIFFGVISLIFSVLSFLMPLIVPILIVVFITKLFKDWLK